MKTLQVRQLLISKMKKLL